MSPASPAAEPPNNPPTDPPTTPPPAWFEEIRSAAERIGGHELSQFLPPPGRDLRQGAVLMLFGHTARGGLPAADLLLTERAHTMRSHPGQVSFPGGAVDPGETAVEAALREAEEETGLDRSGVHVAAQLPQLWIPVSNFAVTPVLGWWARESPVAVVDPGEVHAIHRVTVADLLDPTHRASIRHPRGFIGPGFLIGEGKDVICWGFTAGIISRLFDALGWTRTWDEDRVIDLPDEPTGPLMRESERS